MKANIKRIKTIINKNEIFLRDTYHVKDIGIFGSVVREQNTEASDIDLLVEFSQPVGFFKFIQLEKFLGKILHKDVDLVTKKALKSAIKEDILREIVYV